MEDVRTVHLILYANGEPFTSTKQKTIESLRGGIIENRHKIVIHDYDLDRIQRCAWFKKIEHFPQYNKPGRRDGYFNSWKAFIVQEVYDRMAETDILYYVDSSQYFCEGFTESIEKLCEIATQLGHVAGSVGDEVCNNSFECCDKLSVWDGIFRNGTDCAPFLPMMHVLNSWFLFTKNDTNKHFIDEWAYYTTYSDDSYPEPFATSHHTGDQCVFNILVYKYGMRVFYEPCILHNANKNKNLVLQHIETCSKEVWSNNFIRLSDRNGSNA